jgi:hypothetical protein
VVQVVVAVGVAVGSAVAMAVVVAVGVAVGVVPVGMSVGVAASGRRGAGGADAKRARTEPSLVSPQRLRQLGDVGGDAPGLSPVRQIAR